MKKALASICRRLDIEDSGAIEIEAKKRVLPEDAGDLRKYLLKHAQHEKRVTFFDQFLDTPQLDLLRLGASLRLRYKGGGSNVYLQYKGPGFHREGLLYRSEFSSERLDHVVREESHHDMVQFTDTSVRDILERRVDPAMTEAMRRHLGRGVVNRISQSQILCSYQKDKFIVDLGSAFLEPSLDRLYAFHINRSGLHSLSMFWEYENEIKAGKEGLEAKLDHVPDLLDFDEDLADEFDLRPEKLDKYHRCASYFVPLMRRNGRR